MPVPPPQPFTVAGTGSASTEFRTPVDLQGARKLYR